MGAQKVCQLQHKLLKFQPSVTVHQAIDWLLWLLQTTAGHIGLNPLAHK